MKTEKEKMLAGELYRPDDEELTRERKFAKVALRNFNFSEEEDKEKRSELLNILLQSEPENAHVEPPFFVTKDIISNWEKMFT